MKRVELKLKSEIRLKNIKGFLERTVTSFGTGAKVDCLKEYLGKKVILVIIEDGTHKN